MSHYVSRAPPHPSQPVNPAHSHTPKNESSPPYLSLTKVYNSKAKTLVFIQLYSPFHSARCKVKNVNECPDLDVPIEIESDILSSIAKVSGNMLVCYFQPGENMCLAVHTYVLSFQGPPKQKVQSSIHNWMYFISAKLP